jgi:hypothetical protein
VAATGSPSPFDGLYKPTSSIGMAKAAHNGCNMAMQSLRVRNGTGRMTWRDLMQGPVNPDGSMSIGDAANMLTGSFANGVFQGKLETPVCVYTVTLSKS